MGAGHKRPRPVDARCALGQSLVTILTAQSQSRASLLEQQPAERQALRLLTSQMRQQQVVMLEAALAGMADQSDIADLGNMMRPTKRSKVTDESESSEEINDFLL